MVEIVLPPQNHPSSTKAVVLMYGWVGAIPRHVKKYANLYAERGCAVVYDIAPVMATMTRFAKPLDEVALRTIQKACEVIKYIEEQRGDNSNQSKVPVIIHYFSNGGAFVAERLDLLIKSVREDPTKTQQKKPEYIDEAATQNLLLISERCKELGYEVADSAPCYLYREAAANAINSTSLNFAVKALINTFIFIAHGGYALCNSILKHEQEAEVNWRNMIENDLCNRQFFIYSIIDHLADPVKIDDLIDARKKRGVAVQSVKFDDSDHVAHLVKHPTKYRQILDDILKEVIV